MPDLSGYDLVLASTESALNSSIAYANFWKVTINCQLNPDVPVDKSPGLVDAKIAAPTLRLSGHDLASNQAAVTLQFTAGALQYLDVIHYVTVSQDIAGWAITFAANIGQGAIPGSAEIDQLPAEVQNALSNERLSVGQLFLELSTVVWANVTITDADGNRVTDAVATQTLETALQSWARSIESAAQQWVLNYVVTSSNGAGNASADLLTDLVPTSYNFSVSKYDPPGTYDDLSTLNYLMMTEGRSAPTANSAGIFDFNWVAGPNTQQYQGAVAIDGPLFDRAYVEPLLLPAIAAAVSATKPTSTGLTVSTSSPGVPTFTRTGPAQWSTSQSVDLYGNQNGGKGQKLEGLGLLQAVYQNIIEKLDCTVTLDPASATYHVKVTYTAVTTITVEFVGWDKTDSSFSGNYVLPWSFDVRLKASSNGSLVTESTEVQEGESSSDTWGNSFVGDIWAGISEVFSLFLNTYQKQFQDKAASVSQSAFANVSDELEAAMGDISAAIVFPAGNRFAYKDVRFDSDQSLVAYVTYIN
ncbi:hypothetical protein [Bosea sp. (in: a-proteobacteria)]|uniref:hypothetical protein n=1 Tax=Bosea sp. (in: a-proteobacteria) TaxID=1871050 RepID=UPI002FC994A2